MACVSGCPPGRVEWGLHASGLPNGGCPEGLGLVCLIASRHAAGGEEYGNQPFQVLRVRVVQSSFPVLDGGSAHPHPGRQLTLGQPCAAAMAQKKSSKRLAQVVVAPLCGHAKGRPTAS